MMAVRWQVRLVRTGVCDRMLESEAVKLCSHAGLRVRGLPEYGFVPGCSDICFRLCGDLRRFSSKSADGSVEVGL